MEDDNDKMPLIVIIKRPTWRMGRRMAWKQRILEEWVFSLDSSADYRIFVYWGGNSIFYILTWNKMTQLNALFQYWRDKK
jgi:hypothetical protein